MIADAGAGVGFSRTAEFFALAIAAAGMVGAAEPPEDLRLDVVLRPRAAAESLRGELVLAPLRAEAGEERRAAVEGTGTVAVTLPAGVWRVCPDVPGWWGPCGQIELGSTSMLGLDLWPTARLTGTLRLAPGVEGVIPDAVTAQVQPSWPPAAGFEFPKSELRCPVQDDRRWACTVPAGLLDASVRVAGFVPRYAWGVEAPRGEEVAFGEVVLRRGSSLVGQVEVEGGDLGEEARAAVTPALPPGGGSVEETKRLARVRLEAPVGPRGFFQIQGIPPGSYVLEVTQPGFAPARAFPVDIWPESETVFKSPLTLRRPLDLEVVIQPSRDWMDRPWRLRMFRRAEFSSGLDSNEVFHGPVGEDGRVELAGQAPGEFVLSVEDADGNRVHTDLHHVVRTPAEARITVELDTIFVEGELVLGDEPIPGRLWFGGRQGGERMEMAADLEGRFSGVLPRGGHWKVDVEAADGDVRSTTRVEVAPGPSGDARVRVELPDTELFGRVVDAAGEAVAGATAMLGAGGVGERSASGDDGSFTFRGFPPGIVAVSARAKRNGVDEVSDGAQVTVSESVPRGPVVLTLRPVRRLGGQVVSSRGPVPGAMVDVMPVRPVTAAFHDSDRADLEGRFEIDAHPAVEVVQITLSPAGFALSTQEAPATGEWVLEVVEEGGTLVVEAEEPPGTAGRHRLVVLREDLVLPTPLLHGWAQGHGVQWSPGAPSVVPMLAPGTYRACLGSEADFARGVAERGHWSAGLIHCASGFLEPGGELRLEVAWSPEEG